MALTSSVKTDLLTADVDEDRSPLCLGGKRHLLEGEPLGDAAATSINGRTRKERHAKSDMSRMAPVGSKRRMSRSVGFIA